MLTSLMCVVGLCFVGGVSALNSQPFIRNAITESAGNTQATTSVTFDGFVVDENYDNNYVLVNFDSPSPITHYDDYELYGNAFGESVVVDYDGNYWYDVLANANSEGNMNVDMVLLSTYRYTNSFCYFYVSAFINTQYALSLSQDGVNAYFDIYTQNFSLDLNNAEYFVYSYTSSFFDIGDMPSVFPVGTDYYRYQLLGYDPVGADYDFSPITYDSQTQYYASESETYLTGHHLGFSFSYPNFNTNGVESYNARAFLWNFKSYCIQVPNDLTVPTSPFGDSVYVSFAMKGLEAKSNDQYYLGYNAGHQDGYIEGYNTVNGNAYQEGYNAGFNDGSTRNITWYGLFGAVADTPLVMLRGLFNYQLFGINVLSVVLSLLTGLIVFYLIRKLI